MYPFGYGLTYGDAEVESAVCMGKAFQTGHSWSDSQESVKLSSDSTDTLGDIMVTVAVTNRSNRATDEVIQIYIKALDSPYAPLNPRLCAFGRIRLSGQETRLADLRLCSDAFCVINDQGEKQPGGRRFLVSAGLGQPDDRTKTLTGKECVSFLIELPLNA